MEKIFYEDLNESGKEKALREAGIEEPEEANWDVMPLFILEIED